VQKWSISSHISYFFVHVGQSAAAVAEEANPAENVESSDEDEAWSARHRDIIATSGGT
jgi:hypothetical protein